MFEKSLLHKIYNRSYTHLGGSLLWHFSFKALLHSEQLRRGIFKNELIALNAEWNLHWARGLMTFKNEF